MSETGIVTTSPEVPGFLVCTVGAAVPPASATQLVAGLQKLDKTDEGRAALDAVRLAQFVAVDAKKLAAARASYDPPAKTAHP